MRKNSVRKFIHAVIDVLPLLVIPIFALNILHKEVEPISLEVQEKIKVNFNQKIINDYTLWTNYNYDSVVNYYDTYVSVSPLNDTYGDIKYNYDFENHIYIFKFNCKSFVNNSVCSVYVRGDVSIDRNDFTLTTNYVYYDFRDTYDNTYSYIDILVLNECYFSDFQLFDLTQMFGSGNEPSISDFNLTFPNDYYDYTLSDEMLIDKPSLTTFNNTDIGSQFVYAMYKPVNDYFNFNNLFNMGAIYDWVQLNLFNGTAPLPVFIIWNIIVYEFFVDLLFLFYAVFMFVIDFAEKCLDRPFRRM